MSRRTLIWTLAALAALATGAVWTFGAFEDAEVSARATAARARAEQHERERDERWQRLSEESAALMPQMLEGLELGMSLDAARRARPRMAPKTIDANPNEPGLVMYEERFPNGARGVYAFERDSQRLQRIQVLSQLPNGEAIAPHLQAMNEQYGTPTGVWDCPRTGSVPTRRFTWRHGQTTISDVFLVYGGQVSVTLYVAPTAVIGRSLRMAQCHPVRDRGQLGRFPVASPQQMMDEPPAGGGAGR